MRTIVSSKYIHFRWHCVCVCMGVGGYSWQRRWLFHLFQTAFESMQWEESNNVKLQMKGKKRKFSNPQFDEEISTNKHTHVFYTFPLNVCHYQYKDICPSIHHCILCPRCKSTFTTEMDPRSYQFISSCYTMGIIKLPSKCHCWRRFVSETIFHHLDKHQLL